MTLTPERLAELRKHADTDWVNSGSCRLSIGDLDDLLQAADNLNALLAAAENAIQSSSYSLPAKRQNWSDGSGELVDNELYVELRDAIRRAKGEP